MKILYVTTISLTMNSFFKPHIKMLVEEGNQVEIACNKKDLPLDSLYEELGCKLGIITDGRPEGQRAKIKALKLAELVDQIIITDELGGVEYRKPDKSAFVKMQQQLNVPFEKMCYVGDNIKKDFIASDILGMKSILFRNKNGLYY